MQAAIVAPQAVQCTDVFVRSGRKDVVSELCWSHHAGGIAWLVGSNGSGKSSLLRVLAGWQKVARGNVAWLGVPGKRVRFSAPSMNGTPELRGADFVAFANRFGTGQNSDALDTLFPHSADLDKSFKHLSTGEAKRLLLWAVFRLDAAAPIVFDEPYEHLSRDAKQALTQLLRAASIRSVVIVATNQEVPPQSTDTILTLDNTFITVQSAEGRYA